VSPGDDPLAERKKLTFEEAQGSAPLPRQLALGEISQEFRAALWNRLNQIIGAGFAALYGYTSDEQGIRHAHLNEPSAKPDEADAVFMVGACAAFVCISSTKPERRAFSILSRRG
jgi:hypothetical protein